MKTLEKINTEKINKWTMIVFTTMIFIILAICPEIRNIGFSTLKTMMFIFTTVLAVIVFTATKLVDTYRKGEKDIKIEFSVYEWLLIGYFLLILISSVVSEYGFNGILWGSTARGEGLITMFSYLATFVIFEKNFKYSERFFKYSTIAVVLVSIWGIVQTIIPEYINLPFINKEMILGKMAVGNMMNPNFFSSFLLIFLPIYMVKFLKEKNITYLFATAIVFTAFVCARTLSGYLTVIIVFVVLSIVMYKYIRNRKEFFSRLLILIITLIISFGIITLINGKSYFDELISTKGNFEELKEGSNSFGSNRGLAWKIAIKVIKDYPVFGTGLETFGLKTICNERYYYKEYAGEGYYFDKAHCEYLQIAAVTGIPALIVYLTLLLYLGVNLIKRYNKILKNNEQGTESVLCIMAALSIFSYIFQAGANISITCIAPIFWAIMGIAANLCSKNTQQNIDK